MATLLLIDDEKSVRYSFRYVFADAEDHVEILTAATAAEGLTVFRKSKPDVVVLDLQLPDRSGLEIFQEIRACDPKRPVIFLTAHGTTEAAIEAMKNGAFDYLVKPVNLERLTQILTRAIVAARLMHIPALLPTEENADRIVGRTAVMQEMCKDIGRIAPQDVNVLILGESGTGKELVARALYFHSRRADKPFLAINCAAIPETLLESELLGHEQGAFTGANRRRIGKFEQCDGGTLFLDEIGDMVPSLQAKMLRVLQEQRFERLGGNQTLQTNVRVLTATNQDLEKLVEAGRFRKDLYYRLKGATIRVPALRDRLDDLAELAHYFLCRFNRELGTDLRSFSQETLNLLQNHFWPGNIRELQGVIREAALRTSGRVVLPEFLPEEFRRQAADKAQTSAEKTPSSAELQGLSLLVDVFLKNGQDNLHAHVLEIVERMLLPKVIDFTEGHLTKASEILGFSRNTLRQKMRSLGLILDKILIEDDGNDRESS